MSEFNRSAKEFIASKYRMKVALYLLVLGVLTVAAIFVLVGPGALHSGMISGGFNMRRLAVVGGAYVVSVVLVWIFIFRVRP